MRPAAIRAPTRLTLTRLQMLRVLRGVKRTLKLTWSTLRLTPSIQPKQSASPKASEYPIPWPAAWTLNNRMTSSVEVAWFLANHWRNPAGEAKRRGGATRGIGDGDGGRGSIGRPLPRSQRG